MAETLHEMAVRLVKGVYCDYQCGEGCGHCPLSKLRSKTGVCLVRRIARVDNCEEQIEGLRAWAAEHPVPRYPTWNEWHRSMFPSATAQECYNRTCITCIDRQIPADIAAKLGIRPMEEG